MLIKHHATPPEQRDSLSNFRKRSTWNCGSCAAQYDMEVMGCKPCGYKWQDAMWAKPGYRTGSWYLPKDEKKTKAKGKEGRGKSHQPSTGGAAKGKGADVPPPKQEVVAPKTKDAVAEPKTDNEEAKSEFHEELTLAELQFTARADHKGPKSG